METLGTLATMRFNDFETGIIFGDVLATLARNLGHRS